MRLFHPSRLMYSALLLAPGLIAQPKLPETGPEVRSLFPPGAQKGTTVEITFRGRRLDDVSVIQFLHPGIQAEVCRAEAYELVAIVSIGEEVPAGIHDYRMISKDGATAGALHISDLPNTNEIEPNNLPANAQKVKLPVVVNGVIENNDTDQFAFHAEAGETLLFQIAASRLGAGLDSQLTILDSRGNEIEFSDDDGVMADSKLQFQPKTKGDYILQVANAFPFGGPFNYYRLTMGKLPSISNVFPLGLERGKASEFVLSGVNLDQLRRVSLGSAKLPGTIVETQPGQARVRFQVPTEFPTGITALHFASEKNDFTAGISVLVSDTPESISTAARVRTAPQRIAAFAGISGVIAKNRAADFYEFDAKAGERLAIELHGASIGSEIDPAILLCDASGRVLVFQDEPVPWYFTEPPSADPYLVHRFEQAGRYLLAVRDSAHNGGPGYFYHLSIRPAAPDFRLVLNKPAATLYRGRKNTLTVRVKRFGGWDTPVEVWAEADNGAFQRRNGVAEPKNSTVTDCNAKRWQLDGTDVDLELEIPANARAGDIPIRIRGRGVDRDGRIVERTLTSLYYPGFSGPRMGTVQYQDLYTTITDLPPLILDVPQNFNLVAGKTEKLRINVNRYDEGKESRRVIIEDLPPGVTVEPFELPANSDVIELKLTAAKEAKAGTYLMRVKTGDIVTPKIELKINPAPEKKP